MKTKQSGVSVVVVALVLVIVGLVSAGGWYMWHLSSNQNKASTSVSQQKAQAASTSEPTDAVLPAGWMEYRSQEQGLRIGYPKEWGAFDTKSMHTQMYQDDAKNLQGWLGVTMYPKNGFSVVARKYGATISPSADGKTWTVTQENPAAVDGYKVGDSYKTKPLTVRGGVGIDLSYVDEDCSQTRWLIGVSSGYALVALPELCPINLQPISASNRQAYDTLLASVLETITVF